MSGDMLILLELLLVFGLVVGFGVRELMILRRYRAQAPAQPSGKDHDETS